MQIGSNTRLGESSGAVSFDGGSLRAVNNVGASRATTINAGGATFEVASGFTTTWNGNISGTGGLTKTDAGSLVLGGDNSFTGSLAVNAGVLDLNNSSGGAAASAGSVTVASSATLLISQSHQISDDAVMTLSGGTIQRASGVSEVFGNLTIAGGSALDFGTGVIGDLQFQSYTYTGSSLIALQNFLPGNRLQFLSTSFTEGNLAQFDFNGFGYSSGLDGDYFTITAIPEPSTMVAVAALLVMLCLPKLPFRHSGRRTWCTLLGKGL